MREDDGSALSPPPAGDEGRRIARNSALLGAGDVAGLVLGFATNVLLINQLGDAYGLLIGAQRFVSFFLVLAAFGLHPFLVRWIAGQRGDPGALLGTVLAVRAALSLAFLASLGIAASLGDYLPGERWLLWAFAGVELIGVAVESWQAVCEGRERMGRSALIALSRSAATFVAVGAVVLAGGGLAAVLAAYAFGRGVQLVAAVMLTHGAVPMRLRVDWSQLRPMLGEALIFVAIGFAFQGWRSLDVVMLTRFAGEAETARFGAALLFVDYLMMLPAFVGRALLPAFSRLESHGSAALVARHTLQIFSVAALPAAAGLSLLAEPTVALLYSGEELADTAPVLEILAVALVFAGPVTVIAMHLTGAGLMRLLVGCYMVTLPIQAAVNYALIPDYGAVGVAVGSLVGHATLGGMLIAFGRRIGLRVPWGGVARHAAGTALLVAAVLATRHWPLPVPIAAGGLAYAASLAVLLPRDGLERRILAEARDRWRRRRS